MTDQVSGSELMTDELLALARLASERAWSPYSGVKVGAVVVGAERRRYTGCNVESASFGLTQCAERNALGAAIAGGEKPGSISVLLVYANGFASLSPCGACRQVMSELMAEDAVIMACSDEQPPRTWQIGELFPEPFNLK
jgi:cytidine deaminase